MKRTDLIEICKKYKIPSSGTKKVLEKRIEKAKFFERHVYNSKIVLHPFDHDMYIHITKNFIVDKNGNEVIGKLDNVSNKIVPLNKNDIQVCKDLRLQYVVPILLVGEVQKHRIKSELEEDDESDEDL